MSTFEDKVKRLFAQHEELITRKNEPVETTNGVYTRYKYPVVTAAHTPIFWRYDLDEKTNPYLMERIGMNATMNSGAIKWNGKYLLVVRVEGADRKSFFAVAESPNGVDNFRMRMVGFMAFFVQNVMTIMHLPVICLLLQLRQLLPVRKT